ncbi:MAG: hypothetical protein M3R02_07710 [Chloroflexota bacterium]|nr:hypothetical protein [Chloroflexota bacterium]
MQRIRTWGVVLAAIFGTFAIVLVTLVLWPGGRDVTMAGQDAGMTGMETPMPGMEGMATPTGTLPTIPPVSGFYAGQEILFIHPEASDEQIGQMLTQMMGSPVLVVPQLADVPASALANVYVFTNGVTPEGTMGGPLGFQPDVFDSAPGDEGYRPLRAVNLVTWTDEATARVLRSVEEITAAEQAGELTIERPGAVVNMPFLTWPGGHR